MELKKDVILKVNFYPQKNEFVKQGFINQTIRINLKIQSLYNRR